MERRNQKTVLNDFEFYKHFNNLVWLKTYTRDTEKQISQ